MTWCMRSAPGKPREGCPDFSQCSHRFMSHRSNLNPLNLNLDGDAGVLALSQVMAGTSALDC